MGKFWDWILTNGDWEQTQRIQLYKKLGKKLDEMSEADIKRLLKELKDK